jgi:hypothetical protein
MATESGRRALRSHIRNLADSKTTAAEEPPPIFQSQRTRARPNALALKSGGNNGNGIYRKNLAVSPDMGVALPFGDTSRADGPSRKVSTGSSDSSDSGNGSLRAEDYVCNSASVSPVPPVNSGSGSAYLEPPRGRLARPRSCLFADHRRRILSGGNQQQQQQQQQEPPPHLERVKSFNRNVRRARSFRGNMRRERSLDSSLAAARRCQPCPRENDLDEVTFAVSRPKYGRRGWRVMPEEESGDLRDPAVSAAIEKVAAMIREIEFAGHVVPERITIKLS